MIDCVNHWNNVGRKVVGGQCGYKTKLQRENETYRREKERQRKEEKCTGRKLIKHPIK